MNYLREITQHSKSLGIRFLNLLFIIPIGGNLATILYVPKKEYIRTDFFNYSKKVDFKKRFAN